jgi:hypothetical protein
MERWSGGGRWEREREIYSSTLNSPTTISTQGYTADLDVRMDASGTESVFTQWHDFRYFAHTQKIVQQNNILILNYFFVVCSIMFHVSTLLPFEPNNPQQVGRKRFIGNDLVSICVWRVCVCCSNGWF